MKQEHLPKNNSAQQEASRQPLTMPRLVEESLLLHPIQERKQAIATLPREDQLDLLKTSRYLETLDAVVSALGPAKNSDEVKLLSSLLQIEKKYIPGVGDTYQFATEAKTLKCCDLPPTSDPIESILREAGSFNYYTTCPIAKSVMQGLKDNPEGRTELALFAILADGLDKNKSTHIGGVHMVGEALKALSDGALEVENFKYKTGSHILKGVGKHRSSVSRADTEEASQVSWKDSANQKIDVPGLTPEQNTELSKIVNRYLKGYPVGVEKRYDRSF